MRRKKNYIKIIMTVCILYAVSFYISKILIFLGSLQWGLFSEWSNILGLLFGLPTSKLDITLMAFKLGCPIIVIGTLCLIYCIYRIFNPKI